MLAKPSSIQPCTCEVIATSTVVVVNYPVKRLFRLVCEYKG